MKPLRNKYIFMTKEMKKNKMKWVKTNFGKLCDLDATHDVKLRIESRNAYIEFQRFVFALNGAFKLDELDEDALVRIICEPKNALVKQYKKLFDLDGIELVFEDDALKAIAHKAIAQKTGARGLRSIVEGILMNTMFTSPSETDITSVIINKDSVTEDKPPIINYGKKLAAKKWNEFNVS